LAINYYKFFYYFSPRMVRLEFPILA
jgi:hypothetical protein